MSKKLEIGDSVSRVSKVQIDGEDVTAHGVASINGKKHIPWGVGTSPGGDCLFPGYNFVLKSLYGYAEDASNHFDDNIPVVMGNDPATAEQSFKYSVPIRDGHGRMFTYCGTQKYHAELEYEVMNLGAVKYVINQKTPDLPAESDDGTYVLKATKSGSTITYSWVKEQ